jgi:hypothetical protein
MARGFRPLTAHQFVRQNSASHHLDPTTSTSHAHRQHLSSRQVAAGIPLTSSKSLVLSKQHKISILMLSRLKHLFQRSPSFDQLVRNVTPQYLITNRPLVRSIWRRGGAGYGKRNSPIDTPLSSLYRLYHFIVKDTCRNWNATCWVFPNQDHHLLRAERPT